MTNTNCPNSQKSVYESRMMKNNGVVNDDYHMANDQNNKHDCYAIPKAKIQKFIIHIHIKLTI